jgi:hypothetical protein
MTPSFRSAKPTESLNGGISVDIAQAMATNAPAKAGAQQDE